MSYRIISLILRPRIEEGWGDEIISDKISKNILNIGQKWLIYTELESLLQIFVWGMDWGCFSTLGTLGESSTRTQTAKRPPNAFSKLPRHRGTCWWSYQMEYFATLLYPGPISFTPFSIEPQFFILLLRHWTETPDNLIWCSTVCRTWFDAFLLTILDELASLWRTLIWLRA